MVLTEFPVALEEVDLGEHIDVGQLEVQHGVEGQEERTQVLVGGGAEVGVDQVHGGQLAGNSRESISFKARRGGARYVGHVGCCIERVVVA